MKTTEFGPGYNADYSKKAPVEMSFFDTQIGHFTKVIAVLLDGKWVTDKATCNEYNH